MNTSEKGRKQLLAAENQLAAGVVRSRGVAATVTQELPHSKTPCLGFPAIAALKFFSFNSSECVLRERSLWDEEACTMGSEAGADPPSDRFPSCLPRARSPEPLCPTQPASPWPYPVSTAALCPGRNPMGQLGKAALQPIRALGTGRGGSSSGKMPWQAVPRSVW